MSYGTYILFNLFTPPAGWGRGLVRIFGRSGKLFSCQSNTDPHDLLFVVVAAAAAVEPLSSFVCQVTNRLSFCGEKGVYSESVHVLCSIVPFKISVLFHLS